MLTSFSNFVPLSALAVHSAEACINTNIWWQQGWTSFFSESWWLVKKKTCSLLKLNGRCYCSIAITYAMYMSSLDHFQATPVKCTVHGMYVYSIYIIMYVYVCLYKYIYIYTYTSLYVSIHILYTHLKTSYIFMIFHWFSAGFLPRCRGRGNPLTAEVETSTEKDW